MSETFADIEELASQCRFRDCAHEREPGCAVRSALGVTLEEARLESYRKLLREQAFLERKLDTRAALAEKERWKKIHRDAQADYRFRKGR